jgi:hypothetical protein
MKGMKVARVNKLNRKLVIANKCNRKLYVAGKERRKGGNEWKNGNTCRYNVNVYVRINVLNLFVVYMKNRNK